MHSVDPGEQVRLTATVSGWVQGVGFRWATMTHAQMLQLVGVAQNLPDGAVLVIAEGSRSDCQRLLDWLQGTGSQTSLAPGRVDFVDVRWGLAEGGFGSFTCR